MNQGQGGRVDEDDRTERKQRLCGVRDELCTRSHEEGFYYKSLFLIVL